MTRIRLITISVIVVAAIIIIGAWFYLFGGTGSGNTSGTSSIQKTLQNFFPFGQPAATTTTPDQNQTTDTTGQTIASETPDATGTLPRLRKVSNEPVSGASLFSVLPPATTKKSATTTTPTSIASYIEYVQKADGHIYKEDIDSPTQFILSATTIPKIDTAFLGKNNAVAYQYFKNDNETLETFLGQIVSLASTSTAPNSGTTADAGKVSGTFLPQDIYRFNVANTGDRIFYLIQNINSATGYVANIDGTKSSTVITTPLREWNVSWPKIDTILMTTAPDSSVPSYLYALNLTTKNFSQVLGGINGLTAIANSDLSYYLYSESTFNGFETHIYRPKDGFDTKLNLTFMPEKCTWSTINTSIAYCAVSTSIPSASYPESWYRGDVAFTDNIWKIDLKGGTSTQILNFGTRTQGQTADMIDLSVDQGDNYLIFKNKNDDILWEYRVNDTKIAL